MEKSTRNLLKKELIKEAQICRDIQLREIAARIGVNHIKTEDVISIASWFVNKFPSYKAVRSINPHIWVKESLFTTMVFTEFDETEDDFEMEA